MNVTKLNITLLIYHLSNPKLVCKRVVYWNILWNAAMNLLLVYGEQFGISLENKCDENADVFPVFLFSVLSLQAR